MTLITQHAAFLIPVIDGEIHLIERNTEPHKGKYCGAGGKGTNTYNPAFCFTQHQFMHKDDYALLLSRFKDWTQNPMKEAPAQTAIRETTEELFTNRAYPQEFTKTDFTQVYTFGYVDDTYKGRVHRNHHTIAFVNRDDFSLSEREVASIQPLSRINPNNIVPITRAALRAIYNAQHYRPAFGETEDEIKFHLSSPLRTTYRTIDTRIAEHFTERNFVLNDSEVDTGEHPWSNQAPARELSDNDRFWKAYGEQCIEQLVQKQRAELLQT